LNEDPSFPVRSSNGIRWICSRELEALDGCFRHFFLSRQGGVSEGVFSGLNMAHGRGDLEGAVRENRRKMRKALGLPMEPVTLRQSHGDSVVVVRSGDQIRLSSVPAPADAFVTILRQVPLMVLTADCLPVVVLDAVTPALGLVHAGWRGTALGILAKTIRKMAEEFGTRPGNCLVAVGPGISPGCYEVGVEVRDAFRNSFPYWEEILSPAGEGHWKADLREANRRQALDVMVQNAGVSVCSYCTHCETGYFYSARRDGNEGGRQGTVVMLT